MSQEGGHHDIYSLLHSFPLLPSLPGELPYHPARVLCHQKELPLMGFRGNVALKSILKKS